MSVALLLPALVPDIFGRRETLLVSLWCRPNVVTAGTLCSIVAKICWEIIEKNNLTKEIIYSLMNWGDLYGL
jgi:hypothetical protein